MGDNKGGKNFPIPLTPTKALSKLGIQENKTPIKGDATPEKTQSAQKRKADASPYKTPIKKMRVGEQAVTHKLIVVALEKKRIPLLKKEKREKLGDYTYVTLVVGSDGKEFVQLTAWGLLHANEFGKHFTEESIGKTFQFKNFHVVLPGESSQGYNFGSVSHELKYQDCSSVIPQEEGLKMINPVDQFYQFLEERHKFKETQHLEQQSVKLQDVYGGEKDCQIEVQIISVSDLNIISQSDTSEYNSTVCNVHFAGPTKKGTISGWNTYAKLLQFLFKGKEGQTLVIKASQIKMVEGFPKITWDANTKYTIFCKQSADGVPVSLVELIGYVGLNKLKINVKPLREAIQIDKKQNISLTVVTDGEFKAQMKLPTSITLEDKCYMLQSGSIHWSVGGVLTITIFAPDDIQPSFHEIMKELKEEELDYPPMD